MYPPYGWNLLSAFAEDHGLCPWMKADSATGGYSAEALAWVPEGFTADGRRRVFQGGTMGFAHGPSCHFIILSISYFST
jgi:hypothetical protein